MFFFVISYSTEMVRPGRPLSLPLVPSFVNHRFFPQCNPELSALITKSLKVDKSIWLKDLERLKGLLPFAEDPAFREEWAAIKQRNKERLAHHVQVTLGLTVNTNAMFDVQIKVRCQTRGVLCIDVLMFWFF